MKKNGRRYAGAALIIIAMVCAFVLNIPTMGSKAVSFTSSYGDTAVTLKGTYTPVKGAEYAALICPGYSCDRQKWRPVSDLLAANGISVLSFDYSGQGASYGAIGFDNAKNDNIPVQIGDAVEYLHELSGVDYGNIILVGHSMGGRSILRLLYDYNCPEAVTTVTKHEIGNAILLSPEVNYEYNAQASLFAGTSDSVQEPWASYNESYIGKTNVYLFGSTGDDIVSDEDIHAIFSHLGAENVPGSGVYASTQTTSSGTMISAAVVSGVLHSYEMYSPKFAELINSSLESITGKESTYAPNTFLLVYLAWFSGLLGITLTLSALSGSSDAAAWQTPSPVLVSSGKYLLTKALLWIPGIIAALVICSACVCMPFGSPVMNIPYMCFIAGYGFVMLFAYRKGSFPGTMGKLPGLSAGLKHSAMANVKSVAVCAALCFAVWYILRASMYRLIPLNFRLVWVIIAAVMMTVAYYISGCENDMLRRAGASQGVRLVYNLIQYFPLILLVLFYLVLKSYSGLIGQVQNMVLMYVFCIPMGNYISHTTGSRLAGAITTGFLFQTVMITSAALISMF